MNRAKVRSIVTLRPTVSGAALASSVATLIIALLEQYTTFHPTGAVAGAIVGICAFLAGYFMPRSDESAP